MTAQLLERKTFIEIDIPVIFLKAEYLVKCLYSFAVHAQGRKSPPLVIYCFNVGWVDLKGPVDDFYGFLIFSDLHQCRTLEMEGRDMQRLDCKCLVICLNGICRPIQIIEGACTCKQGIEIIRPDTDRLVKCSNCIGIAVDLRKGSSLLVPGNVVFRRQREKVVVGFNGFLVLPECQIGSSLKIHG